MATTAVCHQTEAQIVGRRLTSLPGVHHVSIRQRGDCEFDVLVVTNAKDLVVERSIVQFHIDLLNEFPELSLDFRIFVKRGRELAEVIGHSDRVIFERTAA